MKVLVTGGAGYIGSITVECLVKAGMDVVVFDNLYQGHAAAVHPGALFVQGDLADDEAVNDVLAEHQPDGIMHFASYTLVGESWQKPAFYLRDNVLNGYNLLQRAVENGVRRFILSSTANLFDDPERIPIEAEDRIVPGSPYGESKYILERYLNWFERIYGLRYAALRYFNACGATDVRGEDHAPETHLIPLLLEVALGQRDHIMLFGDDYPTPDGTCIRDYIHVIDLAQAHILALQALDGDAGGRLSRHYNLGIGRGYSVKEVIDAAREVTGHPIPVKIGPRRAGDPAALIAGNTDIRRDLGWEPTYTDIREIIATAWKWRQAHPNGYGA